MSWFSTIESLLMLPFLLVAVVMFLVGIVRKTINYRSAFVLLAFLIVLLLVWNLSGPFIDELRAPCSTNALRSIPVWPTHSLFSFLFSSAPDLPSYCSSSGAEGSSWRLARPRPSAKHRITASRPSLCSTCRNERRCRVIGCAPLGTALSRRCEPRSRIRHQTSDTRFFLARMPALSPPSSVVCLTLFILFGFVAPLASAYVKRTRLAHLLWLALGIVWFAGEGFFARHLRQQR